MNGEKTRAENDSTNKSLGGFLNFARENGIRISTPEWLSYLGVIKEIGKDDEVLSGDLFDTLKSIGMATLVKHKADLAAFSDSFDEYFKDLKAARDEKENSKKQEIGKKAFELFTSGDIDVNSSGNIIKEQLGIEDVAPNNLSDADHDNNENVHGGQLDQHNDILSKQDKSKDGGGNKGNNTRPGDGDDQGNSDGVGAKGETGTGEGAGEGDKEGNGGEGEDVIGKTGHAKEAGGEGEDVIGKTGHAKEATGELRSEGGIGHSRDGIQKERTEFGVTGNMGGKGKYDTVTAENLARSSLERIVHESGAKRHELPKAIRKKDRRERYNVRPDRTDVYEIVKNLRRIITDTSQMASSRLDVDSTVQHFAKKEFKFDYENEREIRPETVLFIDVGGPVDEWRPLMEELSIGMSRGLLKLEIYLFHNQLYGYCWDVKDGNYARANGLKSVKDIVKKRKKVIIYGDANMANYEVEYDSYLPSDNEEKIKRYGMGGLECLSYIKKNSDNVVWINPKFKSSWYYDPYYDVYDTNNSVGKISNVIPMYDLSIGGVQDAIAHLMKK